MQTDLELEATKVRQGYRFTIWRVRRAPSRPGIWYESRPHWIITPNVTRKPKPPLTDPVPVVAVADGMIELSERDAIEHVGFLTGLLRAREALRAAGANSADLEPINAVITLSVHNRHGRFHPSKVLR